MVPPLPTAVAVPVACPKQSTLTDDETVAVTALGWLTVTEVLAVQPLASVEVTL